LVLDDLIKYLFFLTSRRFITVRICSVESASFKFSKREIRPSSKQRISLAGNDLFDVREMTAGDIRVRSTCVRCMRV